MKNNLILNETHNNKISYALSDNNVKLPIIDITHPLFVSSIDENAYHLSNIKSENKVKLLKKLPSFVKARFSDTSDVDNSYLSGMRTMIYKLGPNLAKGVKLNFRDKWIVKQTNFMGLRIRLRDISKYQAQILIPKLKGYPGKNLCFFNIAGGPSSDSINTLFLIQDADPELLNGRKIEINILDTDTFGPNFAKRCLDVLKLPGERFHGLDITIRAVQYNWSKPEQLLPLLLERSEWLQICSSEGGLFEYGSDEDIIQNLNQLYTYSGNDTRVVGSLIFNKSDVCKGYLGFAELTRINVRFLGLTGLNNILSKTKWVLENNINIDNVFTVFIIRKSSGC